VNAVTNTQYKRRDEKMERMRKWVLVLAIVLVALVFIQPAQGTPPPPSWSVLIDQSVAGSDTSSLRGVAVSSDGSLIYTTWIQQYPTFRQIREYTSSGTLLHSFSLPASPTNPTDCPAGYEQAKSIAVDDRGYVYIGSGDQGLDCGTNPYILVLSSDLTTMVSGKVSTTDSATMQKRIGGAAIWKNGGRYYLYISRESGTGTAYIQRFDVTNPADPVLDTTFGSGGTFDIHTLSSGAGSPEGLTVAADGTIYVAANSAVYRISSNLASASSATVNGAFYVSLFGGYLFVTQYLANNSHVAVLDPVSLALVETITPPFPHLNTAIGTGYSGIGVSSGGEIYVADQYYNEVGGLYSDRLLVGTLQVSSITVSSSPTGSGLVTFDSTPITTPQTSTQIFSSTHTLSASSTVSCGTGCHLVFVSWTSTSIGTVGSASFTYTVPASAETVTANYKYEVDTATGVGAATFTTSAGEFSSLTASPVSSISAPPPAGLTFPDGLFSFTILGLSANQHVTVTITLPAPLPAGTFSYYKFQGGAWTQLSSASLDSTRTVITLTFTADTTGTINDPGGPAIPGPPVTTTTTTAPPIPEYPLGLPLLAILMIIAYGLIKRRTRNPKNI
jgi:hypothetical protein